MKSTHITLTCGCVITARSHPMNNGARYPCPNGLGHGYNVAWHTYVTPSGFRHTNPKAAPNG